MKNSIFSWPTLMLLVSVVLGGCASAPQSASLKAEIPHGLPVSHMISEMAFFPQDEYQCGPAALATVLTANSIPVTPEELVPLLYLPERHGSIQTEVVAAARYYNQVVYTLAPELEDVLREVAQDNPVLVMQNLGLTIYPQWHFAVVTGYDLKENKLFLNSGEIENYSLAFKIFERTWQRGGHWAITLSRADELPATATPEKYFLALSDLAQTQPESPYIAQAYDSALERWPHSKELLMGRGNLYYTQGSKDAALKTFSTLVNFYPNYAPAQNNLAYLLYEAGNLNLALIHARRALALSPNPVPAYMDTYTMILEALSTDV